MTLPHHVQGLDTFCAGLPVLRENAQSGAHEAENHAQDRQADEQLDERKAGFTVALFLLRTYSSARPSFSVFETRPACRGPR